jgi:hypothetical protein
LNDIDELPKCIKKAVRYIKQDAPPEQLSEIKKIIGIAISLRKSGLQVK